MPALRGLGWIPATSYLVYLLEQEASMSVSTKLFVLSSLAAGLVTAQPLTIVNGNLGNVPVECGAHAYQSYMGGTCNIAGQNPQENFNSAIGIGWTLPPLPGDASGTPGGDGILGPDFEFDTPPFTGLPFSRALFLQGPDTLVVQPITGFVPGGSYTLSFYLGSRYASGSFNGNQTVEFLLDGKALASWPLASFTPFTLETVPFRVRTGGTHLIEFEGTAVGDHTAFLSGITIEAASDLAVSPASAAPGGGFAASATGFLPFETVNLVAYGSTTVASATGTADSVGRVKLLARLLQTPFGACGLQGVGQTSGTVKSGLISVTPRASANPNSGTTGSTIVVTGEGYAAGEPVVVTWSNPATTLELAIAKRTGTFAFQFAIPLNTVPGAVTVTATGQKTGGTAMVNVTVVP